MLCGAQTARGQFVAAGRAANRDSIHAIWSLTESPITRSKSGIYRCHRIGSPCLHMRTMPCAIIAAGIARSSSLLITIIGPYARVCARLLRMGRLPGAAVWACAKAIPAASRAAAVAPTATVVRSLVARSTGPSCDAKKTNDDFRWDTAKLNARGCMATAATASYFFAATMTPRTTGR
jgi:hypothetical protein